MAAVIELKRLQGVLELQCSCCLQEFEEPVRLSGCDHSFCRGCILRYCAGRPSAVCPLCRRGFELRHLRPNRELAAVLSLIPRELKEKLETQDEPEPSGAAACNDWSSARRGAGEKVRPEAAWVTIPDNPGLLPATPQSSIPRHPGASHPDSPGLLSAIPRDIPGRHPEEEEIWESSRQQEITAETVHLLRKELNKIKEYTSQIKNQIAKDFCCMKEYVDRQERNTLMFIEQEQKAAQQKIEETIHQLTDIRAPTSNLSERQRCKGSSSTNNETTLDEKLNVVKSAVENLKRKLEILLLENYAQQLPPVEPLESCQEPSVCSSSPESAAESPEPTISRQFSQWADDVTFDPIRVHEHLALTAQNRRVMVSKHLTSYEPSPKRFCISQVLCSQCFSTGCHYWEVITKDSDGWAIGVAHEMIGKRDKLGRTEHSWCVEWLGAKKQLSAWHKDQETLLHKNKPLKVGVFLELQKKTVSFYSIADKEMLLHTFEISTSNPLYPAFWLYSLERNGSLTISQPNRR